MQIFSSFSDFNFGEEIYTGYGRLAQVNYTSITLVAVETGELILYNDGFPRRVSAGEAALVRFQDSFMAVVTSNQQTRVLWCDSVNPPLTTQAKAFLKELPSSLLVSGRLRELLEQGYMLTTQEGDDPALKELQNALGLAAVCTFVYEAGMAKESPPIPATIRQVKEYIDNNYQESCGLDVLVELAALTPSYLIRKFKKFYGVTPTKYLWHIRAKKGVELLQHSSLNISVISDKCGFQNAHHFSRVIKNTFGYAPRYYRNRVWQENPDNGA